MSSFFGLSEALPSRQEIALKLYRVAEFDSCLLIILRSKKLHAAVVIALGALLRESYNLQPKGLRKLQMRREIRRRDDEATETYWVYTPYVPSF